MAEATELQMKVTQSSHLCCAEPANFCEMVKTSLDKAEDSLKIFSKSQER